MCSILGDCGIAGDRTDGVTGATGGAATGGYSNDPGPGRGSGTGDIAELGRALDELADAAQAQDAEAEDVADILYRAWEMVARLDPELARRLSGYGS